VHLTKRKPTQPGTGLSASAAGVVLADPRGQLRVAAVHDTNQRLTNLARYVIDSPTADFPPQPRV
jgi:hypothetical protein